MRVTYMSVDSLAEGIGASQVGAYVEQIGLRGIPVTLHTFEKQPPKESLRERMERANVEWKPHAFGRRGALGGLRRILSAARSIGSTELVHARSDLAAAATLVAGVDRWLWDFRSFYVDQKIELGELKKGSAQEKVLRRVERRSATRCSAIVTLTHAALPVLAERYGPETTAKAHVITTCVDTIRFQPSRLPPEKPMKLLLAGTVNAYYDVPLMLRFVERLRDDLPTEFHLSTPDPTRWDTDLDRVADHRTSVELHEMPALIDAFHAGLCVCRENAGVSLAGSMPTKIGEFLASGRPVIVNPSLGDAGKMLEENNCGVTITGGTEADLSSAVDKLRSLLGDPDITQRCRALAEEHFDLHVGVDRLIAIYEEISTA